MERCSLFDYLAVDTEGYIEQGLLGISVAHPGLETMYFPIGHKEDVNLDEETHDYLKRVLSSVPYRVFHNAGHDLLALPYLFDLPFADTMIIGHMVDENVISKSLDWMYKTYCNKEGGKQMDPLMRSIIDTMGWYYVPYMLMYEYGAWDARITMELFIELLPRYKEQFGELWSKE